MKNNRFKNVCALMGVGACFTILSITSFISQRSFKQASAYTYDSQNDILYLTQDDFYNDQVFYTIWEYASSDENSRYEAQKIYFEFSNRTYQSQRFVYDDSTEQLSLINSTNLVPLVEWTFNLSTDNSIKSVDFYDNWDWSTLVSIYSENQEINDLFFEYGHDIIDRFQFLDSFNYNAPYLVSQSNQIVQDTYFSSISALYKQVEVYSGYFFSNGNKYDKILFNYANAQGSYFEGLDNSPYSGINYGFFLEVWYKNTETGVIDIVCKRNQSTQVINNGYVQRVDNGVTWSSSNYKTINFTWVKNDTTTLEASNSVYGNYTGVYNDNDVGLGGAFSLISTAFNAVVGLFTIQIFPGLTLGLLVLLPLIAGIIVLIIWIVKR